MKVPFKPPVAGAGSTIDPKKPIYKDASGYTPVENVNQGPGGGKKGKVAPFHGQNSDDMAAKNSLVSQSQDQKDPYRVKGTDFPVSSVMATNKQSGGKYGTSEGKNELAKYNTNQEGPRHIEDDGPLTPVPGNRGAKIASNFSIETNKGEGNSDTGEVGISQMIDLQTGHIVGGETGPTNWVPQSNVTVGKSDSKPIFNPNNS